MANLTTEQMLGNMRDKISQTFARQNGFYETMGVGTAVNLAGQQDRSNADKFRTSGDTEDIATGTARIETIKGNAIAWNNLSSSVVAGTGSTGTVIEHGIKLTSDRTYVQLRMNSSVNGITGHTYYIAFNSNPISKGVQDYMAVTFFLFGKRIFLNRQLPFGQYSTIATLSEEPSAQNVTVTSIAKTSEETISLEIDFVDCAVIDLSLIYGLGHEPTTPEQFEADYKRWFGKALGYEPYDAGSLKPVLMTGYKTVGFNLLNPTTGKAHLVGTYGNTDVAQGLYCYEITGNYTAITDEEGNTITPVNGFFMVENPQEITVTGADENTCIHLTWSGWRNGESETYWSDLSPIPVTTLTGKLNGEGTSVTIFADGMKKVGNTYDELKIENSLSKAIKRIGSRAYQEGDVSSDTMLTDGSTTTYYILATPQEYILDNFELPIRFKVDDFGTEEQIGEGVASILTLKYGVNAVDVLRRMPSQYISIESMDNFLAQLGVAMNGTWSKSWNEANQEYDFTFQSSQVEPENTTNQEET